MPLSERQQSTYLKDSSQTASLLPGLIYPPTWAAKPWRCSYFSNSTYPECKRVGFVWVATATTPNGHTMFCCAVAVLAVSCLTRRRRRPNKQPALLQETDTTTTVVINLHENVCQKHHQVDLVCRFGRVSGGVDLAFLPPERNHGIVEPIRHDDSGTTRWHPLV